MNVPPSRLLMQISNNPSAEDFVGSFGYTRRDILESLAAAKVDFAKLETILDFGCGVGRFLFAIQPALGEHQRLFGCDVDEDCATWCRENIDFAEIRRTNVTPPLPYPDASFDFVYALSVFTHLSFELQHAWAAELHRVMRPGGVIFFTTHGELHLPLTLSLAHVDRDFAMLGDDGLLWTFASHARAHSEGQREVAVIHSRSAIDHVFSAFEPLYHRRISDFAGGQSLSIRRRPADGSAIVAATPADETGALSRSQQSAAPVAFSLPGFAGTRRFRVWLSFDERWHGANEIDYLVEVVARDGRTVKRTSVDLPFKSFGGPRHFLPLTIDVPGDGEPCRVVWTLSWKRTWRPEFDPVRFRLSNARLES